MSESLKLEDEPGDDDQNLDMKDEEDDIEEWNEPSTSNDAGNDNDQEDISMKNDEGSDEEDDEEEENNSASNNEGGDNEGGGDDADMKQDEGENADESSNKAENMDAEENGSSDQPSTSGYSKVIISSRMQYIRFKKSVFSQVTQGNVVVCRLCNWRLPYDADARRQNRSFLDHLRSRHSKAFCCTKCPFACVSESAMREHQESGHEELKIVEENNNKKKKKTKKNFYKCNICSRVFAKSEELWVHWDVEHISKSSDVVKLYSCTSCRIRFCSPWSLKKHISKVHPDDPTRTTSQRRSRCPACRRYFGSEKNLQAHTEKFHKAPDGEGPCSICFSQTLSIVDLMQHIRDSHSGGMFKCSYCPFTTAEIKVLRSHLSKHKEAVENRRFNCRRCGHVACNIEAFRTHLVEEHGSKLYQCNDCDRVYVSVCTLRSHIKKKHCPRPGPAEEHPLEDPKIIKSSEKQSSNLLKCFLCEYKTGSHMKLVSHLSTHRGFKENFPNYCAFCNIIFDSERLRIRHYASEHPSYVKPNKNRRIRAMPPTPMNSGSAVVETEFICVPGGGDDESEVALELDDESEVALELDDDAVEVPERDPLELSPKNDESTSESLSVASKQIMPQTLNLPLFEFHDGVFTPARKAPDVPTNVDERSDSDRNVPKIIDAISLAEPVTFPQSPTAPDRPTNRQVRPKNSSSRYKPILPKITDSIGISELTKTTQSTTTSNILTNNNIRYVNDANPKPIMLKTIDTAGIPKFVRIPQGIEAFATSGTTPDHHRDVRYFSFATQSKPPITPEVADIAGTHRLVKIPQRIETLAKSGTRPDLQKEVRSKNLVSTIQATSENIVHADPIVLGSFSISPSEFDGYCSMQDEEANDESATAGINKEFDAHSGQIIPKITDTISLSPSEFDNAFGGSATTSDECVVVSPRPEEATPKRVVKPPVGEGSKKSPQVSGPSDSSLPLIRMPFNPMFKDNSWIRLQKPPTQANSVQISLNGSLAIPSKQFILKTPILKSQCVRPWRLANNSSVLNTPIDPSRTKLPNQIPNSIMVNVGSSKTVPLKLNPQTYLIVRPLPTNSKASVPSVNPSVNLQAPQKDDSQIMNRITEGGLPSNGNTNTRRDNPPRSDSTVLTNQQQKRGISRSSDSSAHRLQTSSENIERVVPSIQDTITAPTNDCSKQTILRKRTRLSNETSDRSAQEQHRRQPSAENILTEEDAPSHQDTITIPDSPPPIDCSEHTIPRKRTRLSKESSGRPALKLRQKSSCENTKGDVLSNQDTITIPDDTETIDDSEETIPLRRTRLSNKSSDRSALEHHRQKSSCENTEGGVPSSQDAITISDDPATTDCSEHTIPRKRTRLSKESSGRPALKLRQKSSCENTEGDVLSNQDTITISDDTETIDGSEETIPLRRTRLSNKSSDRASLEHRRQNSSCVNTKGDQDSILVPDSPPKIASSEQTVSRKTTRRLCRSGQENTFAEEDVPSNSVTRTVHESPSKNQSSLETAVRRSARLCTKTPEQRKSEPPNEIPISTPDGPPTTDCSQKTVPRIRTRLRQSGSENTFTETAVPSNSVTRTIDDSPSTNQNSLETAVRRSAKLWTQALEQRRSQPNTENQSFTKEDTTPNEIPIPDSQPTIDCSEKTVTGKRTKLCQPSTQNSFAKEDVLSNEKAISIPDNPRRSDCSEKTVPRKRTKLRHSAPQNSFTKENIPSNEITKTTPDCSEQPAPRKSARRQPKSSVGDVNNAAQPSNEPITQNPKKKQSSGESVPQRITRSSIQSQQQQKDQPDSEKTEEDSTASEVVSDISVLAEPKPVSGSKKPNEEHVCDKCNFVAPGSLDLTVHMIREHSGNEEEFVTFDCPHCTFHTTQEFYMKVHLAVDHEDVVTYRCPYCDYSTQGLEKFRVHRLIHTAVIPTCSFCGYVAVSKGALTRHITTQHERPQNGSQALRKAVA